MDIDASGRVEAHVRVATTGCTPVTLGDCGFVDFHDAAVIGGDVRADFGRAVRVVAAADLRAHAGTALESLDDSGVPAVLQPLSMRVREASVTMAGEHVDLSLGARALHWGVADGINPANVVNPYDLEDPTRFDRRLAVPMVDATVHVARFSFEGVWVPFFVPAALPTAQVDLLADAKELFDVEGASADVREVESRVTLPDPTLGNSAFAARTALGAGPVDLALSWFHGRDSLPQVGGEVLLTGFQTDTDRVDVGIPVVYPRVDVGGLEVRGELPWQLGGWVEAALVLPERTEAALSRPQLEALATLGAIDEVPDPIPVTVTQDGAPFARWVVGLDRGIGRFYVNAQWLHGFPVERRADALRDYGVLAVRVTLADKWVVSVRGVSDGRGVLAGGELSWLVGDAAELSIEAAVVDGADGSALRGFRGVSHVGTGVVARF